MKSSASEPGLRALRGLYIAQMRQALSRLKKLSVHEANILQFYVGFKGGKVFYVQHLYTCSFRNFKYSPEDNMFLLSKKSLWKKNTDAL